MNDDACIVSGIEGASLPFDRLQAMGVAHEAKNSAAFPFEDLCLAPIGDLAEVSLLHGTGRSH